MSHVVLTPEHDPMMGPLGPSIASFTVELSGLGYRPLVVRGKRAIVRGFIRWAVHRRIEVARIDEATVEAYLVRRRRRGSSVGYRRCTLRAFLEHLRAEGIAVRPKACKQSLPRRRDSGAIRDLPAPRTWFHRACGVHLPEVPALVRA